MKERKFPYDPPVDDEAIERFIASDMKWCVETSMRMPGKHPPCIECTPKRYAQCALTGAECLDFKSYVASSPSPSFGRITEQ